MIQLSRKDELAGIHSDVYKSIHGIRPRWFDYSNMTEQQLEEAVAELDREYEEHIALEKVREVHAIKQFELKLADLITSGAKTRENAIRWLHDGCGTHGDNDFLCWEFGLPYGYLT